MRYGTLHFLSGKLASGKSTVAARLAEETGAVLVSEDIWLSRLFPGEISTFADYLNRAGRFRSALAPHVRALLMGGMSVVLDFGGNVPRERAWVRSLCDPGSARLVLHYVKASDDLCKRQLRRRNLEQPAGSQVTTEEEFESITKYFVAPDAAEGFDITVYDADLLWGDRLPQ
jgi:predicted kinase